jgi:phospholipase/carboxylesterase
VAPLPGSPFTYRYEPATAAGLPTVLALHGTGGDEHDLIPIVQVIAPGAAVISPRGNVLEQGMPRFFRRLAEGVFDEEDLARRTIDLGDFLVAAARHHGLDPARIAAVGYSNGANIAASLLLARPVALAGAVLLRPMVPFEPARVPDLSGRRILISAGERDPIIPRPLTARLAQLLTAGGAEVATRWYPGGHALSQREIADAAEWFRAHLAG